MEQKHIAELQTQAVAAAALIWAKFQSLYPELKKHNVPNMVINNRLKATGGRAGGFLGDTVELSAEMFFYNQAEYYSDIIPHELAHMVDFYLTGNMGHGPTWKSIMSAYGIEPNRLHNMTNPMQVKRDIASGKLQKIADKVTPKNPTFFKLGMRVEFQHRDRQRNITIHRGAVTKINQKTIKLWSEVSNSEWTVPIANDSLRNI